MYLLNELDEENKSKTEKSTKTWIEKGFNGNYLNKIKCSNCNKTKEIVHLIS